MLGLGLSACEKEQAAGSLVNPAHLEHLYETVGLNGDSAGAVWIYCEAPDYELVADEDEGFTCVDDVARALVFYCRQPAPDVERIRALTRFLFHMQADNGYFYNFLLPGGIINRTHRNSVPLPAWWSWRAFWALSELNLLEVSELAAMQARTRPVLDTLVSRMQALCPPPGDTVRFDGVGIPRCLSEVGADQVAVIVAGLANHYRKYPSETVRTLMMDLGNLLLGVQLGDEQAFPHGAFLSWRNNWHAWGNLQAYALLQAGRTLEHQPFIEAGLREVRHFYPYYLEQGGLHAFRAVRAEGTLRAEERMTFPQIAYGVRPMVFASLEAYEVTGDTAFAETAARLAAWFFGENPAGARMYDPDSGRGYDGINDPSTINRNAGAESTIEALLSLQAVERHPPAKQALERIAKTKDR